MIIIKGKKIHTLLSKKLLKSGAIYVVTGSFLTKFVSFFGSIFLVRLIEKSDYGVLSYYENFIGYFTILAGGGLAQGLQRYIVLADSFSQKKACFEDAIKKGSIWNVGLILVAVLFFLIYPHPVPFNNYKQIAIILSLCIPFAFLLDTGLYTLRALFDYKSYSLLAFATAFILIVMRASGAAINGLVGTVKMRFIGEILCAAISLYYVYIKFFRKVNKGTITKIFKKERDIYSIQIMFTNGLWAIFMLNDLFFLGQLVADELVIADYKIAYVIPANLSILTSAIGVFVAPYFTKHQKENDWEWIKEKFKIVLGLTILIMGISVVVCFVLAKPLIVFLYGENYLTSVPIMRILLISSFINNGVRATIANILSAMGIQKINLYIAACGMGIQILMDLLLIPVYGGLGVAYSSLIVYFVMGVALVLAFNHISRKYTPSNIR